MRSSGSLTPFLFASSFLTTELSYSLVIKFARESRFVSCHIYRTMILRCRESFATSARAAGLDLTSAELSEAEVVNHLELYVIVTAFDDEVTRAYESITLHLYQLVASHSVCGALSISCRRVQEGRLFSDSIASFVRDGQCEPITESDCRICKSFPRGGAHPVC